MPVSRLLAVCNPFTAPPWEGVSALAVEDVLRALEAGLHNAQPYNHALPASVPYWSTEDHIARIAHLAAYGWDAPIEVDVGIPSMDCWVDWPVTDGNHRFAAAIARGDSLILASVAGSCDYMEELFGQLARPMAPPSHAHPWCRHQLSSGV